MRKITVGEFMTLDGVMEAPGGKEENPDFGGWTWPYWDDAIGASISNAMQNSDAMLIGRITYESFAGAFSNPAEDDLMAQAMTNQPKYVVSSTMDKADWANTTIIKGNVIEEIKKLKAMEGKNIAVSGSISLVHALLENDMVDEISLFIYPLVLGRGKRLFPNGVERKFKLVDSQPLKTGVIAVTYERDRTQPE